MTIPNFIKRGLRKLADRFGYEIRQKDDYEAKWTSIDDPVKHNSRKNLDDFYKQEGLLDQYIDKERVAFYKDVAGIIKEKINISSDQTITDVGCGTGHLLYYIKEEMQFGRATGFDFSGEAIKMARGLFPSFEFYEFDIYTQSDQKFDVVLCTEVLEHLLNPELALANLLYMCNSNGSLFLTVPNGRLDTFKGHVNFWSPESWEVFIKKNAGGNLIEIGTIRNDEINFALIIKSEM